MAKDLEDVEMATCDLYGQLEELKKCVGHSPSGCDPSAGPAVATSSVEVPPAPASAVPASGHAPSGPSAPALDLPGPLTTSPTSVVVAAPSSQGSPDPAATPAAPPAPAPPGLTKVPCPPLPSATPEAGQASPEDPWMPVGGKKS